MAAIATFLHNPRAQKYQPSFQEYYNNLKQNYANMHITIYATCILHIIFWFNHTTALNGDSAGTLDT